MNSEFVEIPGNEGTIRGVMHYPLSYDRDQTYSLVVLVVGLNGNRSDLNRILIDLSRELQFNDFFCLRFDFYGMGMSDGFFAQSTISTKTVDLIQVYDYINIAFPKIDRLFFLSLSDGMQVVLNAAEQNRGIRNSHFIFWSPIITDIENKSVSKRMDVRPYKDKNTNKLCLPFLGLWISLDYLKEKKYLDFDGAFNRLANEIRSSSAYFYVDNDIKVEDTIQTLKNHSFVRYNVINSGGHSFCTYESHCEVIEKTITFLHSYNEGR